MIIATNIPAMNITRNLKTISGKSAAVSEKLSSGLRINRAADDAAGLTISQKMKSQIRGLKQAQDNIENGINLIKTMEGGTEVIGEMMVRQRELIVQALNDTNNADDRAKIQIELDQLTAEINATANNTRFNTIPLLTIPSDASIGGGGGSVDPAFSIYTPPMPAPAPAPPPDVSIDFNSLTEGASGLGWSFSGGVLSLAANMTYEINGTGAASVNRIDVQDGTEANVILNNVNITTASGAALDMRNAKVNLWVEGSNHLETTNISSAGIQTSGGELVIEGSGSLRAISSGVPSSSASGAAIGGAGTDDGGTITINSGTITAICGDGSNGDTTGGSRGYGAGIGGGGDGNGGNITINGGTVTAISSNGSGIGSGNEGQGGTITINGGTVNASGGYAVPGIGGFNGGCNITITGGVIHTTGGYHGPGMGSASTGVVDNILITDGMVFAFPGNVSSAAIGGGSFGSGNGANVTIEGGLVEIPAGSWIGAGGTSTSHGSVTITEGNLSISAPGTNIKSGAKDLTPANLYRVQIFLNDTSYKFPAHAIVKYTIGTEEINAITDSDGNLFMYLPMADDGKAGEMESIDPYIFKGTLSMDPDHENTLILKLDGTSPPGGGTADTLGPLWIQGGANEKQGMYIDRYDCRTETLYKDMFDPNTITVNIDGVPTEITLTKLVTDPWEDATASLIALDTIFDKINGYRSNMGAQQNRLEFMHSVATTSAINSEAANSCIEDADMAKEMMESAKYSILQQSSIAMLAQAQKSPENVLHLLR